MRVFKLSDDTCILKWEKGAYIRTGSPLDHDVVFNFPEVIVQNEHIRKMTGQEEKHYAKYLKYEYNGIYGCEVPVALKKDILRKGICEELFGQDVISFTDRINIHKGLNIKLKHYLDEYEEEYVWNDLIKSCL